jgi:antirestriction protein
MEMNFLNRPQATTSSTTLQIPFSRSGARKELVDKSSSTLPFPFKLHQLLEEAEDCCIDHIVSWLPSEEAFKIHDPDAFVSSVMTKYFKQSKIKSFTRQLVSHRRAPVLH